MIKMRFGNLLGLTLLLAAGCSTAEQEYRQLPDPTPAMRQRAGELAKIWAKDAIRAVMLREDDLEAYRQSRETLAGQLKMLHVNYCYIAVETMDILTSDRDDLTDMIEVLGRNGIRCDLVLIPHLFLPKRSSNFFGRIGGPDNPFEDVWKKALKLNRHLPEEYPLAGITLWSELHRLTISNESLPPGMLYRWDENDYGIGSDNDILMKGLLQRLADGRREANERNLTFTVAIPAEYHKRAAAGDLSKGKTADFLQCADRVIVMGYGIRPSNYRQSLEAPLAGQSGEKILCGMVLSGHISANAGAIRRRNWADFLRVIQYMHKGLAAKPGCGGLVLLPYQSIELLLEK